MNGVSFTVKVVNAANLNVLTVIKLVAHHSDGHVFLGLDGLLGFALGVT